MCNAFFPSQKKSAYKYVWIEDYSTIFYESSISSLWIKSEGQEIKGGFVWIVRAYSNLATWYIETNK